MAFSLTWLPEVLRGAGLKVAETEGWTTRGRSEIGRVRGVMLHHTGTAAPGNMPTLSILKQGRSGLPGPLCNLGLGRDGTYYVVAAGRANHAGAGVWRTITTGNSSFIGIEAENAGHAEQDWPDVQLDAYRRGVAALLRRIGAPPEMCCAHGEYARPAGRKHDPRFDMEIFRKSVDDVLRGVAVVRPQIPAEDKEGRPTLARGDRGTYVKLVQGILGVPADGRFGPRTEAAVREFQRWKRPEPLVADGIVGPKTWIEILKGKLQGEVSAQSGDDPDGHRVAAE